MFVTKNEYGTRIKIAPLHKVAPSIGQRIKIFLSKKFPALVQNKILLSFFVCHTKKEQKKSPLAETQGKSSPFR